MGGQHKKRLRAEKAKVKLRGAKLPKGLNVTKTDFKVRKIEIREQLKEVAINEVGQRQLNLKEILSRLKHHSVKFRVDALRNLRDSIKAGQADHLLGHLCELLQGLAAIALDADRDTRRDSFKTLDVLLQALEPTAVSPFFHVLSTYLRCAMTHVLPAVQEDSLLLLDVLLQRLPPQLLTERTVHSIITNFIDMISRTRHDSNQSNRTLIVHLGHGQQTTIKWRNKVLHRMQQILFILQQLSPKSNAQENRAPARTVFYDVRQAQYYNVLRPMPENTCDYSQLFGLKAHTESTDNKLQTYLEQLMPLLQDNWLEVRPTQQKEHAKDKLLLTHEAAVSLYVVLDIIKQLWSLLQQKEQAQNTRDLSNWMCTSYAGPFVRNFINNGCFPYEQMSQQSDKKTSKRARATDESFDGGKYCTPQNLALVQLMCYFCPQPNAAQSVVYKKLLLYVQLCVQHLNKLLPEQQLRLVAALRSLLLDNGLAMLQVHADSMCEVLSACIEAYVQQRYTTRNGVATRLLQTLCSIVQETKLYKAYGGAEHFALFLNYLPKLLLKPTVNDGALLAMSTLVRQLNKNFMLALIEQVNEILAHLGQLQVTGEDENAQDAFESKKRILNLFYYARSCDENGKLEMALQKFQNNADADERIVSYFKCMLEYK